MHERRLSKPVGQLADGARPTDAEIAAARNRADIIVNCAWILAAFITPITFLTHNRRITALAAGAIVGCLMLQHHAIKASRLLLGQTMPDSAGSEYVGAADPKGGDR